MMIAEANSDLVEAARELAPVVRAAAAEGEAARQVPERVVAALCEARLLDAVLPARFGGLERDLRTMARVIEELATADGATGWVAAIALGTSILSAYLRDDVAAEMFGPGRIAVGPVAPNGRADACDGGWRLSGRWAFVSGVRHAEWLTCGSILYEEGAPVQTSHGPDWRLLVVPAVDAQVIDTWSVSGLRATGSHDIELRDVFVPEGRAMRIGIDRPVQQGPLYRLPIFAFLALSIAPVALGVARAAVDEVTDLARGKTPRGASKPLREQPVAQHEIARAESELRGGRALFYATVDELWETVSAGRRIDVRERALARAAAVHATQCAVRAVDVAYQLGGASSIYESSALQRCLRDVHVATQHILLSPSGYEAVGHVLFGVEPPPFGL